MNAAADVPGKIVGIRDSARKGYKYLRWADKGLRYGLPVRADLVKGVKVGDQIVVAAGSREALGVRKEG